MPRRLYRALTPLEVKNAKPGRHADGAGLYLVVRPTGARSWVFRFMRHGKVRDIGLGPAGPGGVSLADARHAAAALTLKVREGIDPLEERQERKAKAKSALQAAKAAAYTFEMAAKAYIAANEASWRNAKHRAQWTSTLESYVYPVIGDMSVQDIETAHVLTIIEPIWQTKAETASRIRGRIEVVMDAAKARGYRTGENPARWRGHLAQVLPARPRLSRGHHKAMPFADLPAFIAALREREAVAAMALEFTILTAARTNEVIGATWAEIDFDKALWTIPPERMKAGRPHRVPLSPRAIDILREARALGKSVVFPAPRGSKMSGMAMSMLLRRAAVDFTVHGFRSSFRDWASECTAFSQEVAEMALSHTVSDKVEAAYRRGDLLEKRRRLMDDWATWCAHVPETSGNVTYIGAARG
jgi:integrase